MKEYIDVASYLFLVFLGIFAIAMIIQSFRKGPNKVGPALKDGINRFS